MFERSRQHLCARWRFHSCPNRSDQKREYAIVAFKCQLLAQKKDRCRVFSFHTTINRQIHAVITFLKTQCSEMHAFVRDLLASIQKWTLNVAPSFNKRCCFPRKSTFFGMKGHLCSFLYTQQRICKVISSLHCQIESYDTRSQDRKTIAQIKYLINISLILQFASSK